jgi:transcriptional regulator with XRE-family HTH domain
VVALPNRKVLGARFRELREQRRWSQSMAARRVPLSQKQWSRLELGDVAFIDRRLLIRLAEIFETPVATGELNEWLHSFGYRPHMVPLLPLPPNYRELLDQYRHQPAIIIDWGRYFRYANELMQALYGVDFDKMEGLRRNWLWHYFHPDGILYQTYPPDSEERVLNRLFWDWQPYYTEPWNRSVRQQLEVALNITWEDLRRRYHIPSEPLAKAVSEVIHVKDTDGSLLLFQNQTVQIPLRPDLYTVVYRPVNESAVNWCRHHMDHPKPA